MINELWNWFTSIPVAIWGSLIAGGMTLVGVLIGQYVIHRRQERQAEKELKVLIDALVVELRTADHWLESLLYIMHDLDKAKEFAHSLTEEQIEAFDSDRQLRLGSLVFTPSQHRPSTNVFQSNTDKIGKLDSEAARHVIEAYSSISVLKSSLQNLQDTTNFEELMVRGDIDWSTGAGLGPDTLMLETQIESAVTTAALAQKLALLKFGENPSDSDKKVAMFAFTHATAKSETQEEIQQVLEDYMDEHDLSLEEFVNPDTDHPLANSG